MILGGLFCSLQSSAAAKDWKAKTEGGDYAGADEASARERDYSIAMAGLLAGGIISAGTGIWWLRQQQATPSKPSVAVAPTLGGAMVTGRF